METNIYSSLLQELGQVLQLPNLQPDSNNTCLIKFKGDIKVQIELDRSSQFLIIGTDLDAIPAGRYRETLFTEALKANGMASPRYGNFAYSKQADHLVLFEMLPLNGLTGQKVADFLSHFLEKARLWKEAIGKGDVPESTPHSRMTPSSGIFGLRP